MNRLILLLVLFFFAFGSAALAIDVPVTERQPMAPILLFPPWMQESKHIDRIIPIDDGFVLFWESRSFWRGRRYVSNYAARLDRDGRAVTPSVPVAGCADSDFGDTCEGYYFGAVPGARTMLLGLQPALLDIRTLTTRPIQLPEGSSRGIVWNGREYIARFTPVGVGKDQFFAITEEGEVRFVTEASGGHLLPAASGFALIDGEIFDERGVRRLYSERGHLLEETVFEPGPLAGVVRFGGGFLAYSERRFWRLDADARPVEDLGPTGHHLACTSCGPATDGYEVVITCQPQYETDPDVTVVVVGSDWRARPPVPFLVTGEYSYMWTFPVPVPGHGRYIVGWVDGRLNDGEGGLGAKVLDRIETTTLDGAHVVAYAGVSQSPLGVLSVGSSVLAVYQGGVTRFSPSGERLAEVPIPFTQIGPATDGSALLLVGRDAKRARLLTEELSLIADIDLPFERAGERYVRAAFSGAHYYLYDTALNGVRLSPAGELLDPVPVPAVDGASVTFANVVAAADGLVAIYSERIGEGASRLMAARLDENGRATGQRYLIAEADYFHNLSVAVAADSVTVAYGVINVEGTYTAVVNGDGSVTRPQILSPRQNARLKVFGDRIYLVWADSDWRVQLSPLFPGGETGAPAFLHEVTSVVIAATNLADGRIAMLHERKEFGATRTYLRIWAPRSRGARR